MRVTLDVPDDVAAGLETPNGVAVSRALLELAALEGYRSERFTGADVMRLLGFPHRLQVDAFLKEHGVSLHHDPEHLERELSAIHESRGR